MCSIAGEVTKLVATIAGELIWYKEHQRTRVGLVLTGREKNAVVAGIDAVRIANLTVSLLSHQRGVRALYRYPITLVNEAGRWTAGPVFAILAGSREKLFHGNRPEFRDLLAEARRQRVFMYVLPAREVSGDDVWRGYVRVGAQRWLALPCPHPEAVYNRIPTRVLEGLPVVAEAKERLHVLQIPLFNPGYFNKAQLYRMIRDSSLASYLPPSRDELTRDGLKSLLSQHQDVYLKPAGGSVGEGMMRVIYDGHRWQVAVMRSTRCQRVFAATFAGAWKAVKRLRLPGHYVIQTACPLVRWEDSPCDFRVLLQKTGEQWHVIGKGVRVAGAASITTHRPNGGRIASPRPVLEQAFGDRAAQVESNLDDFCEAAAVVIDQHYHDTFGEMSMDIGVSPNGSIWFFEANSKPMKFDEPEIKRRSLEGVLGRLGELRAQRPRAAADASLHAALHSLSHRRLDG